MPTPNTTDQQSTENEVPEIPEPEIPDFIESRQQEFLESVDLDIFYPDDK